jgi:hypothetical protein
MNSSEDESSASPFNRLQTEAMYGEVLRKVGESDASPFVFPYRASIFYNLPAIEVITSV